MTRMLLVCAMAVWVVPSVAREPLPVVFDTDITGDVDDVLALAMLHALTDRGECTIEAVTISKIHPLAAAFTDGVNTFYGRPDIPIGVTRDSQHRSSKYLRLINEAHGDAFRYPHDISSDESLPDAVTLLRKILSNAEDNSIVIVQVGLATNLAGLIDSPADAISSLTGRELVMRKVRLTSVMAGGFGPINGNDRFLEANVRNGVSAMQRLADRWPGKVPIIWSDFRVGIAARYPHESIARDFGYREHHIVRESYLLHSGPDHDRPTWDLTSVLQAVRVDDQYFELSPPGRVSVADDGFTQFEPMAGGRDRLMILPPEKAARVIATQRMLVSQPPLHHSTGGQK